MLLLVVALASGCTEGVASDASGAEIYAQLCARCHGAALEGRVGPPLGSGSTAAERPDEYLRTVILRGQGRMPSFSHTLDDEQVERVIGFLRERQRS